MGAPAFNDDAQDRVLQEVLTRVPSTARCNTVCKAWQALLSSDNNNHHNSPCLLFLTKDSLLIHNLLEGASWLQVRLALPYPHSLISKAWSCGHLLLILLGSTLSPYHPGHLSLWHPLSLSLSKLPPFASIWHLISLGFGDNIIVAAGFDCNIQCVIELYHVDHTSLTWQVIGRLPLAFNVQEHDEILYCDGSFYALCMESSMLIIDPHELTLTLHDIPCPSAPKLITSHDCIFMVDKDYLLGGFALWKFDKHHDRWQSRPIESPFYGLFIKVVDIKGVGTSICFILSSLSVMVYDLSNGVWHSLLDCPNIPSSKALTWEPRFV